MEMTPRDRVMAAFAHVEGDRVPAWCGASPDFWEKAKGALGLDDEGLRERLGDDFRRVWPRYVGPEMPLSPGCVSRTIFGVERRGVGYGQPTAHPLAAASLAGIEEFPWPDPAWQDVAEMRADALAWDGRYAILGGDWSPFWHDAIDLLGMERLFFLMYDEPAMVDSLMRHLVDYYAAVSARTFDAAEGAIDIFFVGNDFGSQMGPLLSPDLFARFVLPHLKRLIDLGHDYRLPVMLHCCGGFAPLIPSMIEAGLDALHAIQPCCRGMDLRALKEAFGKKVVFNGCIDSQHVLIEGTPASVRERTREVLEIMKPGGGYIAGASHDFILEETPLENVLAMFDAIREFGRYR
jgi:uroporphyrinogen-III decarboxylase